MKYLRGYLAAGIFGAITYVLVAYAKRFSTLVDMVYPYVIRTVQNSLADWAGQVSFCIWQLLALALLVAILASLVAVVVLRKSIITWAGWVLAVFAGVYMLHTAFWGLNYYSGDLAEDMRLDVNGYTLQELVEATTYYRDKANGLADAVARDAAGEVSFGDFETLAGLAGNGFDFMTHKRFYPSFAGSTAPVKKLGWEDLYTSMGITGVTFGLTGEAAVNPKAPPVSLPFTMCHEMSHRMCIANERDANFAAFLAASSNKDLNFQYSAYFMAFRYCYSSLCAVATTDAVAAAKEVSNGVSNLLRQDMNSYDRFYMKHQSTAATKIADTANDSYLKLSGDGQGIASYGQVCDLLVNWHIQEVVLPSITVTEHIFDPLDETQVDLSGIVNARS